MVKKEQDISVEISIKPLSVNKVWQGRRFKTKEYKDYEEEALYKLPKKQMILGDKLMVVLDFYVKYPKKCDVDNFIKPILDILCKKGYIKDDRMIYDLRVRKFQGDNRIKIKIYKIQKEASLMRDKDMEKDMARISTSIHFPSILRH